MSKRIAAMVLIMATLLATSAFALMVDTPVDKMVAGADGIVRGTVEVLGSHWVDGPRSVIVTDYRLHPTEVWSGPYAVGKAVDFRTYGGTVGDMTMVQEHQPEFRPGEDVLLFLWTQPDAGHTAVYNAVQGVYRLRDRNVVNYKQEIVPLADFRLTIQRALRAQGR